MSCTTLSNMANGNIAILCISTCEKYHQSEWKVKYFSIFCRGQERDYDDFQQFQMCSRCLDGGAGGRECKQMIASANVAIWCVMRTQLRKCSFATEFFTELKKKIEGSINYAAGVRTQKLMSTQIRGDFSSRERDLEDHGIFRFTSSSSALHPFLMILYFPLHALSRAVINCENTSVLITIIHQSLKHTYCLQTKQMCTKLQWGGDNLHLITQSYN